jgi:MFS family permease
VLAVCALFVAPAPPAPAGTGTRVGEAARDRSYRWMYLSAVLVSVALFVPFVHLPAYAEERGVGPVAAAGLIGAIGVASVAGRLALGALAGAAGLLRVFQGCYAAMALSFALWAVAGGSYAAMLAFASVLGVGYGGFVALAPAVVAARFGVANLGALLGALYTGPGLGSAVGPPLAGAVVDAAGYGPAIAGSLVVGLASFAAVLQVRLR